MAQAAAASKQGTIKTDIFLVLVNSHRQQHRGFHLASPEIHV
jgi:hypothetical protein